MVIRDAMTLIELSKPNLPNIDMKHSSGEIWGNHIKSSGMMLRGRLDLMISMMKCNLIPLWHNQSPPTHPHDDVIKWKHFPHYWPFVRGIHLSLVNSRHKGQWRRALMFSLICAWRKGCANNWDAGDLRCHQAHYDVTVIYTLFQHICISAGCDTKFLDIVLVYTGIFIAFCKISYERIFLLTGTDKMLLVLGWGH